MDALLAGQPPRVIGIDIDGTLYRPKGAPMNLTAIAELAPRIRLLLRDPQLPLPVLVTGKPAAYVECFAELMGFTQGPARRSPVHVCENGCVLFRYRTWNSRRLMLAPGANGPSWRDSKRAIRRALNSLAPVAAFDWTKLVALAWDLAPATVSPHELFAEIVSRLNSAGISAHSVALTGSETAEPEWLTWARAAGDPAVSVQRLPRPAAGALIACSPTSLDITPAPMTKASGLAFAARLMGVPLAQTMMIGDSFTDLPALAAAGTAVCVSNVQPEIQAFVERRGGLLLGGSDWLGVRECLDRIIINRDNSCYGNIRT